VSEPFVVDTVVLDLPALAGAFARRLHDAGVPVTAERAAGFAQALALVRPVSRRRLYWTARGALVTARGQVAAFDRVFAEVFGAGGAGERVLEHEQLRPVDPHAAERGLSERPRDAVGAPLDREAGAAGGRSRDDAPERELAIPSVASDEERLRQTRFDALQPGELAQLQVLMERLRVATPPRRSRRRRRGGHREQIDLRRTLRGALRTGGDPIRLARRERRVVPRRLVLLLDISGSMEPYARAYVEFLGCATGATRDAEVFVFATRLTRLTRALAGGGPQRALAQAASAAPDWSSGTRIGDALRTFNDRHGRRGMARGAVVVILSDGWERGDPALVGREMGRLARLAHRIVWVNPRAAAEGFAPRAGGMAAALPHVDALVSGHSVAALEEVVAAIGGTGERPVAAAEPVDDDEPWASATPMAGSSVAMPSGHGPSRGRTTPGWTS
jgi:uncharacterized protein with von Willebrand factor type A (vWA) domain